MRTWDEHIDGGETRTKSFMTLKGKTTRDSLMIVSEAQNILQKKTKACRRDFTVLSSAFDANGSVAIGSGISGLWGDGGGGLTIEALTATGNPLVWTISQLPNGGVAVADGAQLTPGVDYTVSGQNITFLFAAPVNPVAIYAAQSSLTPARFYGIGEICYAYFYPTGSTTPCKVFVIGYPQLLEMRRTGSITNGISPVTRSAGKIAIAVHAGRIYCYPQTGLTGTFVITHIPKLTMYSVREGSLSTGYWANYEANLNAAITTYGPEPEFDFAENGIEAYVAARLLKKMPAAYMTYKEDYNEWMAEFTSCFEDVIRADSPYNLQQAAHAYTGPAQPRN